MFSTIPDVTSSGVSFSSIDFRASTLSPLGFSLATFTSSDPAVIQNQLNTYLAVEAGARSLGNAAGANAFLAQVKLPKFFLGFQQARVNEANGVKVGAAGTVEHQLGKVQKNAGRASKADLDALLALSKQPLKRALALESRALTLQKYADFQISSDTPGVSPLLPRPLCLERPKLTTLLRTRPIRLLLPRPRRPSPSPETPLPLARPTLRSCPAWSVPLVSLSSSRPSADVRRRSSYFLVAVEIRRRGRRDRLQSVDFDPPSPELHSR